MPQKKKGYLSRALTIPRYKVVYQRQKSDMFRNALKRRSLKMRRGSAERTMLRRASEGIPQIVHFTVPAASFTVGHIKGEFFAKDIPNSNSLLSVLLNRMKRFALVPRQVDLVGLDDARTTTVRLVRMTDVEILHSCMNSFLLRSIFRECCVPTVFQVIVV